MGGFGENSMIKMVKMISDSSVDVLSNMCAVCLCSCPYILAGNIT